MGQFRYDDYYIFHGYFIGIDNLNELESVNKTVQICFEHNFIFHILECTGFLEFTFKQFRYRCAQESIYRIIFHLQSIAKIPDDLKALYKTVWEVSQKVVIQMAADRGAFIDQSQSLNIHIAEPNYGKLTSMHFYAWKLVSTMLQLIAL